MESQTNEVKTAEVKTAEVEKISRPRHEKKANISLYSAAELASAAETLFGVSPEMALAALKYSGKEKALQEEAKEIIREFMEREVQ